MSSPNVRALILVVCLLLADTLEAQVVTLDFGDDADSIELEQFTNGYDSGDAQSIHARNCMKDYDEDMCGQFYHQIKMGDSNYDDSASDAIFTFLFDDPPQCIDENVNFSMRFALNGPSWSDSSETPNVGWKNGSDVTDDWSEYEGKISYFAIYVYDDVNADGGSEWNLLDAQEKMTFEAFGTGETGTIDVDSTNNQNLTWPIPVNGTIPVTGREGTHLSETASSGSELAIRVRVHPYDDDGQSADLRASIWYTSASAEPEDTPPTNPSGNGIINQVSGKPMFQNSTWSKPTLFHYRFNQNHAADDNCEVAELRYAMVPSTSTSSPASYFTTSNTTLDEQISTGNTSGEYVLMLQTLDVNGETSSWSPSLIIKVDSTRPSYGSAFQGLELAGQNLPSHGYFNATHPPSVTWPTANTSDAHSGFSKYTLWWQLPTLDGNHSAIPYHNSTNLQTTVYTADAVAAQSVLSAYCGHPGLWVTLQAVDEVGNFQNSSVRFDYDACPPSTPTQVDSSEWFSAAKSTLRMYPAQEANSGESGVASCSISVNGVNMVSTDCDSLFNITLPQLGDGLHDLTVTACDVAGNCQTNTTSQAVRYDATSPTLNFNSLGPVANVWTSNNLLSANITLQDASQNNVRSGMSVVKLLPRLTTAGPPTASQLQASAYGTGCSANERSSCSAGFFSNLADGNWTVWYYGEDIAGNKIGPLALPGHVLIDSTAPISALPVFSQSVSNESSATVLWNGGSDAGSGIVGHWVNLSNQSGSVASTWVASGSTTGFSNLDPGTYSACIVSIDAASNVGAERCTAQNLSIDITSPSLSASLNVTGWTAGTSATLTWSAEDENDLQVRYKRDGVLSSAFGSEGSQNLTNFGSGMHVIEVIANDSAGNVHSVVLTFGVDFDAPTLTAQDYLGAAWTNQSLRTLSWSAVDLGSGVDEVWIQVNGVTVRSNLSSSGSTSLTLTSGEHTISILAADVLGHVTSSTFTARVDLGRPVFASCGTLPSGWSQITPTVYFSVSTNGSVSPISTTAWLGNAPLVITNGTVQLPTFLLEGRWPISLRTSNQGGNSDSCDVEVLIDVSAPYFASSVNLPRYTNSTKIDVSIHAGDDHSGIQEVELLIDGVRLLLADTESIDSSIDISTFSEGDHTVDVVITDFVGLQRSTTRTLTIDRTAPELTFVIDSVPSSQGWFDSISIQLHGSVSDEHPSTSSLHINDANLPWSGSKQFVSLMDQASNRIEFHAVDRAGNRAMVSHLVNVDTRIPSCVLGLDRTWSNGSTRSVTLDHSSGLSGVRYSYVQNGFNIDEVSPNEFVVSMDLPGPFELSVTPISGADVQGNACSVDIGYDPSPDVYSITPIATDFSNDVFGDGLLSVQLESLNSMGRVSPSLVTVMLDDIAYCNMTESYRFDAPFVCPTVEVADGPHWLNVSSLDAAGNRWTSAEQVNVTLDRDPPEVECMLIHERDGGSEGRKEPLEGPWAAIEVDENGEQSLTCRGNEPLLLIDVTVAGDSIENLWSRAESDPMRFDLPRERFSIAFEDLRAPHDQAPEELMLHFQDRWGNEWSQRLNISFVDEERYIRFVDAKDPLSKSYEFAEEQLTLILDEQPLPAPSYYIGIVSAFNEAGCHLELQFEADAEVELPAPPTVDCPERSSENIGKVNIEGWWADFVVDAKNNRDILNHTYWLNVTLQSLQSPHVLEASYQLTFQVFCSDGANDSVGSDPTGAARCVPVRYNGGEPHIGNVEVSAFNNSTQLNRDWNVSAPQNTERCMFNSTLGDVTVRGGESTSLMIESGTEPSAGSDVSISITCVDTRSLTRSWTRTVAMPDPPKDSTSPSGFDVVFGPLELIIILVGVVLVAVFIDRKLRRKPPSLALLNEQIRQHLDNEEGH